MRVWLILAVLLAGCANGPEDWDESAVADDASPIEDALAPTPGLRFSSDWGNATELLLAEGTVNWHGDPSGVSGIYDRASQPIAHPCSYNGGTYFNNVALGMTDGLRNETARIEVVLSWGADAITNVDQLRVGYRGLSDTYRDSAPAGNGEPIVIATGPEDWGEPDDGSGSFGRPTWSFVACMPSDSGDDVTYFDGDLGFEIRAFKA